MTNISVPKLPEGEKVDFDVSSVSLDLSLFGSDCLNVTPMTAFLTAGHLQEASGEGSG